ncbi:unnamed protein product, partial [Owenia fusiformis]
MTISEKAFYGLEQIVCLNLSDNKIHTITEKTFSGMSFPSEMYSKCHEIRGLLWDDCSLNLRSNPIHEIQRGAFQNSHGLRVFIGASSVSMRVSTDAFTSCNVYEIVFDSIKDLQFARNTFNSKIQHIAILNSVLPNFVSETFSGTDNLQSLLISKCIIEEIEESAFGGMAFKVDSIFPTNITIEDSVINDSFSEDCFQGSDMKVILIQNNHMEGFDAFTFQGLALDKIMIISNSNWNQINTNAFSNIGKVNQGIHFEGNNLSTIQSDSFKLSHGINTIRLSRQSSTLTLNSGAFREIYGLDSLVISNCRIGEIETGAFGSIRFNGQSSFTTNITIERSLIEGFFPRDSFQGSNMKQIIFYMNHMKGFEAFAFQDLVLDKLMFTLNSNWTQINANAFSNIAEVSQGIHFYENDFAVIQNNSFMKSKGIATIRFTGQTSKLTILSDAFNGIYGLDSLVISNCRIDQIESNAFGGIRFNRNSGFSSNVTIEHSHIDTLFPRDSFYGSNMTQIIIQMNRLKGFGAFVFQGLTFNKLMIMFNTKWNKIETNTFANIKNITDGIYFQGNKLYEIQSDSFADSVIKTLKFIDQPTILHLNPYSFRNLEHTKSIVFENMANVYIEKWAFYGIWYFGTLLFQNGTMISNFDRQAIDFYQGSRGIQNLQLLDYPIQCNCDAKYLAKNSKMKDIDFTITCTDKGESNHTIIVCSDMIADWQPPKASLPMCKDERKCPRHNRSVANSLSSYSVCF